MSPTPKDKARPTGARRVESVERSGGLRRSQRLGLIIFGLALVALFAAFALGPGIGGATTVPADDAILVENAPDGTGTITNKDFDRALEQVAASSGAKTIPAKSDPQYASLAATAFNSLVDMAWLSGEAADQGVDIPTREVDAQLSQIAVQRVGCPKDQDPFACPQLQQALKQAKLTKDEALSQITVGLITNKLQDQVSGDAAPVTDDEIQNYYDDAKTQFTVPATRDVRLVLNPDKAKAEEAKAELDKGSTDADWARIAKKLSTDPASKDSGGLRPGLTEGLVEEPLNGAIFGADKGQVEGPVQTPLGYYVFEVEKITDQTVQPLDKVRKQVSDALTMQHQQEALSTFVDGYTSKWKARTFCDADLLALGAEQPGSPFEQRCANFPTSPHPANAPASCYEASPKKEPKGCPAPVTALGVKPADATFDFTTGGLEGPSVCLTKAGTYRTTVVPLTTFLPQGPHGPGDGTAPCAPSGAGLPGAVVPPGTTSSPPGAPPSATPGQ